MIPISFAQSNRTLTAPPGMTAETCGDLPIFTDGRHCVSCWSLSWRERLTLILSGRLWLWTWTGETQPPIALTVESPFVERSAR